MLLYLRLIIGHFLLVNFTFSKVGGEIMLGTPTTLNAGSLNHNSGGDYVGNPHHTQY